jgi:preprotein translocase subunit SecG
MKLNTLILGRLMCVIILFGIELAGCSSDGGSKSMDSANRQATVTVNMKADFLTSSLAIMTAASFSISPLRTTI